MPGLAGDPGTLFAAADTLAATGTALDGTGSTVRGHADLATDAWTGTAGDAARTVLDRSAGYVTSFGDTTSRSAPIVRAYAQALQQAQQEFDTASAATTSASGDLARATTARTAAQNAADSYLATAPSAAGSTTTAADARAARSATLAAAVTSAAGDVSAARGRLDASTDGMAAARAALAAADQAATAALSVLTGDLQALLGAIRTSHPAPASTAPTGNAAGGLTSTPVRSQVTTPPHHEEEDHGWGGWFHKAADRVKDTADDALDTAGDFVRDHAEGLKTTSGVLKGVSFVAGALSFVPVLAPVTAPIAVASGAAALGIDAAVKAATGEGSWKQIALDGALMALPGVGRVAGRIGSGVLRDAPSARTVISTVRRNSGEAWKVLGADAGRATSGIDPTTPARAVAAVVSASRKDLRYARPSGFRKGVRDKVWTAAEGSGGGVVRDPLTSAAMKQDEAWHMGHRPGYEFWKHAQSAAERGITRREFLNEHNVPEHYHPELPASNVSHAHEALPREYFGF